MKILTIIVLTVLISGTTLFGQDGSDILYGTVDELDDSYIGDFVHLDFYNRSFRGRQLDTVAIEIDGRPLKFVEHRKDDGFNNWFRRQYLESVKGTDDFTIRIVKSRLDKITADSISVTNYLEYYHQDKIVPEKSREIRSEFSRDIIAEVLVSADSHKGRR